MVWYLVGGEMGRSLLLLVTKPTTVYAVFFISRFRLFPKSDHNSFVYMMEIVGWASWSEKKEQ
jgi:hypothetical protein